MNKKANLKKGIDYYKRAIKVLREQGIAVWGFFIFGNDSETKEVFRRTLDFIGTGAIDMFTLPVLTPLPGTLLYERLKKITDCFTRITPPTGRGILSLMLFLNHNSLQSLAFSLSNYEKKI